MMAYYMRYEADIILIAIGQSDRSINCKSQKNYTCIRLVLKPPQHPPPPQSPHPHDFG